MKTGNLALAAVVLSALGASFAACATQTESNLPELAGSTSSLGGSASNQAGAAASGAPGSAASGAPGTGGAPSAGGAHSAAGSYSTGLGGTPAQAGAPAAAGSVGVAGAPSTSAGCVAAMGTATDLLIDDLEDGDNVIRPLGKRSGFWYTYNDGTAVQMPAPAVKFAPAAPGHTGMLAAHTSGPAFTMYGAGLGFDFNNTAMKSCAYDGSAYTGIKFYAKSSAALTLKAMLKIPATTAIASGGTCLATSMCEDHFFANAMLTTAWAEFSLPFATIAQEGWGTKVLAFDKANLLGVQFQVAKGVAFDFSIDDVTFY